MGNILPVPVSDTSNPKRYVQHQQNDDTPTRSQQPGKAPPPRPPRPPSRSNSTDEMVDNIDKHLTDLNESVRTLKGGKPSETKPQLLKMMSRTERDLHNLNQQMQKEGKSIFYTFPEEDKEILQEVLSENENLNTQIVDLKAKVEAESKKTQKFRQKSKTLKASLITEKKNTEKIEAENTKLLLRCAETNIDKQKFQS
ncbi:uncharacterized protein LOC123557700 [Mercenaria mercenaria]|uniref:uncharacterized protein LOC123557700 n=1 Tax=Mercenaria mercenaria TaxID=6596 RepID=UPI00234E4D16|nr:uncharacterized protein LOC123557700 [Mercenaria mercenaria]